METALSGADNCEGADCSFGADARLGHEQSIRHLSTLYLPTGELRQLTDRFEGLLYGVISPNGRYVYCFADTKGNEIGHFIRIPFDVHRLNLRTGALVLDTENPGDVADWVGG